MDREHQPVWRRSSRCESSGCVEVAFVGVEVWVRDSSDQAGPILCFTQAEWMSFVAGVAGGEFGS